MVLLEKESAYPALELGCGPIPVEELLRVEGKEEGKESLFSS